MPWLMAAAVSAQSNGSPAEPAYREGLAALHSFEYEDANAAFLRAQAADPRFPLAYWGEALTYHQSLWGHEDIAAGRRALARLTARALPRLGDARTRGLVGAAAVLFGEGDGASRRRGYAEAMARVHASDEADPDIASLYALAVLGTTTRSLAGTAGSHDEHSPTLAGSPEQAQAGEILAGVLAAHPRHPGALHYLLHAYDDPAHAHLGLDAAREYARAAPQSSHALHMPAHIFLQLGRWADAEASDRAAFAASEAWVEQRGLAPAMRSYHALAWRQYELLQLGRVSEAAALLGEIEPVVKATGDLTLLSDLASMRARQVVESAQWERLARERNFANVNELCAIGFSAARSGNPALAEMARAGLAGRATAPEEGALRPAIAIMERQVAALIALAGGRGDEAVQILRAATRDELALPPPFGLPIPIIPAPELLGEVLLELQQPAEALDAFAQALARNANRTRSVLGSARAAARLGDTETARRHYEAVLDNYNKADADRPELAEIRQALSSDAVPVGATARWPLVQVAAGLAGLVAAAALVLAVRRRRSGTLAQPAAAKAPPGNPPRKRKRR
jgi:tetratricopeptide (TPR) repeat protein